MAANGQGDPEEITFEELDLDNKELTKEEKCATFLKDKLSEQDFANVAEILGVQTQDLTNAQLLEKLTEMLAGKKKKPGEEAPVEGAKKPEDEYPSPDEKQMADYKAFVKDCMGGGKTIQECAEEWKKKYPEPKTDEEKPGENKPEEKMATLESRIAQLEEQLQLEKISGEVSQLVAAKHLAPIQRDAVIKLSARLSAEDRKAFLDVFTTQKFKVSEDAGQAAQKRPGDQGSRIISPERRAEIIKLHGLDDLINDKAVKKLH